MDNMDDLKAGNIKKATAGASMSETFMIPIENIHVMEGFNVRLDNETYKEHIESLANSIFEEGFRNDKPLSGWVREVNGQDEIVVIDGHSRLAGAKLAIQRGAPLEKLPVVIRKHSNIIDLNVGLIVTNSGQPLNSYEKALVVKRLASFNLSQAEIVRRTGLTPTHISDFLTYLIPAPPRIHEWIKEETISTTLAIDTIKQHRGNAVKVLQKAIESAEKQKCPKKKVTKKDLPEFGFKRFLRDRAPDMTEVITQIHEKPGLIDTIRSVDPTVAERLEKLAVEGKNHFNAMLDGSVDNKSK